MPMISCVLVAALVATHRFAVNGQPVGMAVALGVLAPLGLLSLIPFVLAMAGSWPTDSN